MAGTPLVSAHRGGAGEDNSLENTLAAFSAAITAGVDFVEFDIRLTSDRRAVLAHEDAHRGESEPSISARTHDELSGDGLVDLDTILELIVGKVRAHVDLKVRGDEVKLVSHIVEVMGVDQVIITTGEDASVRELRRWSREHAPSLLIGLSSSPWSHDGRFIAKLRARIASCFPRLRVRFSGANLVVAHRTVAHWSLKAYARRRALPLVVWTVDEPTELARWMNDPDTWIVTTNFPKRAMAARLG